MGQTGMQTCTFASYKKKIPNFLIERSQQTLNRESAMVSCTLWRLHRTDVLEPKAVIIVGCGPYVTEIVNPTYFPATGSAVHRYT